MTEPEALFALAPVWEELQSRSALSSPFLSFDWFWCCRHALAEGARLEVLVVEDGDGPAALVPLMVGTIRHRGLTVKTLTLVDSPDSPFTDLVTVAPHDAVLAAVFGHLLGRRDWDVLRLDRLPSASPTLKAVESQVGRLSWRQRPPLGSPCLTLHGSFQEFWSGRSQRFRKTCRNIQNRLERAGRVAIEEHRTVDPSGPVFAEALDVTRRSWKAERGVAIATMPRMPEFFAELTAVASRRGWLSLWLLRLDSRPIAIEYQIRDRGTVHALRADYDHAYGDVSPGSVLNLAIIRSLFERADARQYDMGPGLNDYKLRWATMMRETVGVAVYAPTLRGRALHLVDAGKQRLRALARRAPAEAVR